MTRGRTEPTVQPQHWGLTHTAGETAGHEKGRGSCNSTSARQIIFHTPIIREKLEDCKMKKRLKRKIEKRRRAEVHRVLDLVLDINGLGKRREKLTGNLPTAFFNFSGHVACIYVRVFREWMAWKCHRGL